MRTSVEKLRVARDRVRAGWCQRAYAEYFDLYGEIVETDSDDPKACRFCSLGALDVEETCDTREMRLLAKAIGGIDLEERWSIGNPIALWNDTDGRSQAEVVVVFDRAIELAEQSA